MTLTRRNFVAQTMVGAAALPSALSAKTEHHTFSIQNDHFVLDGKPFQILSGEMHYPRVPREYWRDRMRKARALGLNTICTYVFWNLHEPVPGHFDFSGNLDLAAYIRTAQEEGLWVILRPGPYICAEWEFGGFPAWLLKDPQIRVRSTDPRFMEPAARYLKRVGQEVGSLQITRGGPILLCQLENEYGSYGRDKAYLKATREMLRSAGIDVTFYTSDGAEMLAFGTLPDVLSVINFGAGQPPESQFATFSNFRKGVPLMCGEYWDGWFDHWGETHHTVASDIAANGYEWMISRGISVNLYMFHGGTSFGFMPGANQDRDYQPDITSYDYDAPLDEAGRPTPKYFAIQSVIRRRLPAGAKLPPLPEPLPTIAIPRLELNETAPLWSLLGEPTRSEQPLSMEALGQSYGFALYRKHFTRAASGSLHINSDVRDFALLYQDGEHIGSLDRRFEQNTLPVQIKAQQQLDILVESMGRVNFGRHLGDSRKGLVGPVNLDGAEVTGWDIYPLPLADISQLPFTSKRVQGPAFYRGRFFLPLLGDTFLDMRGWGKGCVWMNGHNLGRHWSAGPQRSLFVPATWLKQGANEVIVLDLFQDGIRSIEGRKDPIYDMQSTA
jgi:beta-galactosidase